MTTVARDVALTFAGGGNRSFYQLGLMNRWGDALLPRVASVASCSAGACVITTLLSGRREAARRYWLGRAQGITRNFDWSKLFRGERPAPQGEIYRDTLLVTFADGGLERIREQPFPIYVLAAAFPPLWPHTMSVALGIGLYSLERSLRKAPHPRLPRLLGFMPVAVDARICESPEELAALILASSATPPFTPIGRFRGLRLLDGGMIDNAPAFLAERHSEIRHSIVFMSRPYPPSVTGIQKHRLYIAPTQPTPINRWDYTQPHLLDETVAMGEREADVHRRLLYTYLER
ncbi:MAG TPA: patatin-like phospholipase family protein [Gemmatimonadaceae bacterium]|nr:patatin-like phospholipase family protein [Gemmatimonadaceae bacterium]